MKVPPLLAQPSDDFDVSSVHTPHAQAMPPLTWSHDELGTGTLPRYVQPDTPRKPYVGEPPSIASHLPNVNPFSPYRQHALDVYSPIPCLVEGSSAHAAAILYEHTVPTALPSRQGTPLPSKSVTPRHPAMVTLQFDSPESPRYPESLPTASVSIVDVAADGVWPALDGSGRFLLEHKIRPTDDNGFYPLHMDVNGVVWLATALTDGLPYALKQVPLCYSVANEVKALTIGNNPTTLHGCWAELFFVRYHTVFDDDVCHSIQMEYCHRGSLSEAWWSLPTPRQLKACVVQMLQALTALHLEGFVHAAPMSYNILVAGPHHFKLANFGAVARISGPIEWAVPPFMHPPAGHPATCSPTHHEGYVALRSLVQLLGNLVHAQCDGTRVPASVLATYHGTEAYEVLLAIDDALRGVVASDPASLLCQQPLHPVPIQQFILQAAYDEELRLVRCQVERLQMYAERLGQSDDGVSRDDIVHLVETELLQQYSQRATTHSISEVPMTYLRSASRYTEMLQKPLSHRYAPRDDC